MNVELIIVGPADVPRVVARAVKQEQMGWESAW